MLKHFVKKKKRRIITAQHVPSDPLAVQNQTWVVLLKEHREKTHLSIFFTLNTYSSLQSADSPSTMGIIVEIKAGLFVFTVLLRNK